MTRTAVTTQTFAVLGSISPARKPAAGRSVGKNR